MNTLGRTWPSIIRLAAIVAIVIGLALGFNLGRQATVVYRLRREEARLEQAVAREREKAAELEARKAYVQSDAFVEEWARTVAKLTQPGEVRVIVASEGQPSAKSLGSASGPSAFQVQEALPHWQQWWELFFGPGQNRLD